MRSIIGVASDLAIGADVTSTNLPAAVRPFALIKITSPSTKMCIRDSILTNQKHQQTAESEIARLRRAAKVEYINQKFKPAETTKPSEKDKSNNHIEKGLSGL